LFYSLYLLTFFGVLYFTQRSNDAFVRPSGVFFLVYQVPLVAQSYNMVYFGSALAVSFGAMHYVGAALINLLTILVVAVRIPVPSEKGFGAQQGFYRFLVGAGFIAAAVDLTVNLQYLMLDKTERFAGADKMLNLLLIDFDWILIFCAVGIVLWAKKRRILGGMIIGVMSLLGLALGMRYYVAIPLLIFYASVTARLTVAKRVLLALSFVVLAPLFGALLDAVKGYIIFYEWVSDKGFLSYWLDNSEFSLVPGEVGAIGANYWIGVVHDLGRPDFLSYLTALVPGSNRFYDMSGQWQFYSGVANYLSAVNLEDGQGTAFGLMLESYYTFGLPVFVYGFTKWINQLPWAAETRPLVLSVCIYVAINIARNGLVIALAILKVYFILFLVWYTCHIAWGFLRHGLKGTSTGIAQRN
jgi:hypothetical protein